MVDGLRAEGQTPEDLLGLIAMRRADRSEILKARTVPEWGWDIQVVAPASLVLDVVAGH